MPRPPFARPLGAVLLAAALLPVLVGCDLALAPESARPSRLVATPEPTPEPTPVESDEFQTLPPDQPGSGSSLVDAADALADLRSYRVTVSTRGLVPATTPGGAVAMTSTLLQGENPAATFTMTGVDGFSEGRLQAIVIGDEAWLREGTGSWRKSPGGAADFDAAFTTMSPAELVAEFDVLSPALKTVGIERRNGQRSEHLRAEASDAAVAAAGLTAGSIDLWRATTGGALVAVRVDGTWTGDDGVATPVVLRIDVSHVDDAANRVVPPG
jgi:hypothetical protein